MRGGSILPIRQRPRMASTLMKFDPFTLRVALDKKGRAKGELYLDDGETYSHRDGQIVWREFAAKSKGKTIRLTSQDLVKVKPTEAVDGVALTNFNPANEYAKSIATVRVERVIVVGLVGKPISVKVEGGKVLKWEYTPGVSSDDRKGGQASVLTVKDPKVPITGDWTIVIEL
jgi:mannosyl-oligosaccharide alpha-1,3-glucosidase